MSKSAKESHQSWYGWTPDLPDHRDHVYAAPTPTVTKLPPKKDLSAGFPDIYNQGSLGSCTGNAISAAYEFNRLKQGIGAKSWIPSRLFIYYNERVMEGTVDSDAGAMIRDGIKSIAQLGVCSEKTWPYNINQFKTKPAKAAYTEAKRNQALSYARVSRAISQMKGCIASGYPFVFGFTVYDSFESQAVAKTGVVDMPAQSESVLGGHAVVACGYDDSKQRFLVRNSWGTDWGMKGYFTMPYAYLLDENLADDFWTIRLVESGKAARSK